MAPKGAKGFRQRGGYSDTERASAPKWIALVMEVADFNTNSSKTGGMRRWRELVGESLALAPHDQMGKIEACAAQLISNKPGIHATAFDALIEDALGTGGADRAPPAEEEEQEAEPDPSLPRTVGRPKGSMGGRPSLIVADAARVIVADVARVGGNVEEDEDDDDVKRRRMRIMPRHLSRYGYTDSCPRCQMHQDGIPSGVNHTELCRERICDAIEMDLKQAADVLPQAELMPLIAPPAKERKVPKESKEPKDKKDTKDKKHKSNHARPSASPEVSDSSKKKDKEKDKGAKDKKHKKDKKGKKDKKDKKHKKEKKDKEKRKADSPERIRRNPDDREAPRSKAGESTVQGTLELLSREVVSDPEEKRFLRLLELRRLEKRRVEAEQDVLREAKQRRLDPSIMRQSSGQLTRQSSGQLGTSISGIGAGAPKETGALAGANRGSDLDRAIAEAMQQQEKETQEIQSRHQRALQNCLCPDGTVKSDCMSGLLKIMETTAASDSRERIAMLAALELTALDPDGSRWTKFVESKGMPLLRQWIAQTANSSEDMLEGESDKIVCSCLNVLRRLPLSLERARAEGLLQECENIGSGRTSYVKQLANDLIQSWHAADVPDSSSSSSDSDLESVDGDGDGADSDVEVIPVSPAVEPEDMTQEQRAEEAETQKTLNSLLELGELLGDKDDGSDDGDDLEAFTEDEAEEIPANEDLISRAFNEAAATERLPISAFKVSEDAPSSRLIKAFADSDSATISEKFTNVKGKSRDWEEAPTSGGGDDILVQADLSGSDTCSSDEEDPLTVPMKLPSTWHLQRWDRYTPMTWNPREAVDVVL